MTGCATCFSVLRQSRFDATFRMENGDERNYFAIPGAMCTECRQLMVEVELINILGLRGGTCTFAIETDAVLR